VIWFTGLLLSNRRPSMVVCVFGTFRPIRLLAKRQSVTVLINKNCYFFCSGFTVPFSVLQIFTFSVNYGFIPFAYKIESSTRYHLKVCPAWSVGSRLARSKSASILLEFCFLLYTRMPLWPYSTHRLHGFYSVVNLWINISTITTRRGNLFTFLLVAVKTILLKML
jgi:hypothetical protein